ncbi:twin-arginine translocation signal domain-containing protein [Nonomuraea sp. K274]|uniref:Twin-arginine translocation signal domain-containing protein n=1 Tax=Nonomuraea cypriaca TaxID=1187855 RepID=A0A931A766_9ACTN|nr:twin-arginine translocation signal domain-containing protein [Nonomuraea cypriaca]MBF8187516.1 twin-arginine translocation signal domain-containing protein [Nonomuraea cypriaca]
MSEIAASRRSFLGGLALGGAAAALTPVSPAAASTTTDATEMFERTGLLPIRDEMRSDGQWATFLKGQDLVWERIPRQWDEGPFLGNGLLASSIYVPQGQNGVRFDVQHSEVQDYRLDIDAKYGLCRLPIGYLTLQPKGTITGVDWRLDLWNAELTGTITTDLGKIEFTAFVHGDRDVMLIRVKPDQAEREASWAFTPLPSISPRQVTNPDPDYQPNPPSTLRKDGDVNLCLQPLLAGGHYVTAYQEVTRDDERFLYVTVAHSHPEETAEAPAVKAIRSARSRRPGQLEKTHRAWWHAFYPKSFVSLPDQRLQSFYWIQLYKIASATREHAPVMATTGPWLQPTGWPNIWWNLNVQLEYWMINGSNHLELDALTRTLDENRQVLIDHVPEQYRSDSAGVSRSSDMYARGARLGIPGQGEPELGNLTWALHNVWLSYRHTMDTDVLRDVLFPLLRRSVNYYLHFLTPGADGRLHLPTTFSPEYGGAPDCTFDLALIRWGCRTLLESADTLKIDDPLKGRWRQVLDTLVDYQVDENGYMIGAGVPFAKSHRHYSHLLQIYPLNEITWEQPDKRDLIEKSLQHWIGFTGALQGYSFTGAASIAAQQGKGDNSLYYLRELMQQGFIKPNTMYRESGGPVIETPLSAAQSLHDMLVQSWGGLIRIFPAAPDAWPDLTVHNFRTEGAFLVSAVRQAGATRWVRVRSLAGQPCRLRHGIAGRCTVLGARWKELDDGVIELDLRKDHEALVYAHGVKDFTVAPVTITQPGEPWGLPPIPPPGPTTPVDLSSQLDNDGVSGHETMADGDYDGAGYTYPAEELPAPGAYTLQGLTFAFPAYGDGVKNNVTAQGQTIDVPAGGYARLWLLGSATFGDVSGTLTATYADGSTEQVPFTMPNWTGQPPAGGIEALRCTHRHGRAGASTSKVALFAVPVTVDPSKELRSVTLPTLTRPQLHLFALSVEGPTR